jgi:uncharacterized protein YehS (DUF1456 family)
MISIFGQAGHKHYRENKNQVLRNFLKGLQLELRPGTDYETADPWGNFQLP